jgi:hypothetical protein
MGSSQTSAKKDMAEATFAQLPLDLVLGRSSDLDLCKARQWRFDLGENQASNRRIRENRKWIDGVY